MKHYFLGMAGNYRNGKWLSHLFATGKQTDYNELEKFLAKKYSGEAILCKNGRSALALALKEYFEPGDAILINGFTCYAVYEAVKAARLEPVFVDISKEGFNFDCNSLVSTIENESRSGQTHIKGIIIQNTFGNTIDVARIEKLAKKYELTIIEDLAHCAGRKYPDGREVGTVGTATILSFGKDKAIDTVSGGAVVLKNRSASDFSVKIPGKPPRTSDHLRAKVYPMFGAMCRALSYVRLGGTLMRFLVTIHWVEKSADSKLDLKRKMSKFEAKLALKQLKKLPEKPIRTPYLVDNRKAVLKDLQKAGYYFDGFWYEKPVSPIRYYKKVDFPEDKCPNAVFVANHIINLPNNYPRKSLEKALTIIREHLVEGEKDG